MDPIRLEGRSLRPHRVSVNIPVPPFALDNVRRHIKTFYLFTVSDMKTIMFPVLAFSSVAGPVVSVRAFLITIAWIWLHLLQCNTSNQYKSTDEDALNKPWRPLPSGRISPQSTRLLRWSLAVICPCISYFHSPALSMASLVLTFTTIIYDEACLADHWIGKNACGVAGYTSFQAGASMIMGMTSDLDLIAIRSLMCSAIVIFTTLHVQDFADVIGDKATGRVTFPILFPQASRVCAVSAILMASTTLPAYWGLPLIPKVTLAVLSLVIAFRLFVHRSQASDRLTYVIYNAWLITIVLLPLNARWRGLVA